MMKNRPIKVLIIDDEPLARKYIRNMMKDDPYIEIVGEAGSGRVAARLIAKSEPDLIFLDIQMPEMDGFEVLKSLDKRCLPVVIFTTAYEEYAIRAFEFHALDYLLKPFNQARFYLALEHAKGLFVEESFKRQEDLQLMELLKAIGQKTKYLERILVKQDGRIIFLKVDNIDWISSDDKYIHLNCKKANFIIRQTLTGVKSQLDPSKFVQLNRSAIVNIDSIKELHCMFNSEHEVQLLDGTTLPLSRNHKSELFSLLGKPYG